MEGTNIGHENGEAIASVGCPPDRPAGHWIFVVALHFKVYSAPHREKSEARRACRSRGGP